MRGIQLYSRSSSKFVTRWKTFRLFPSDRSTMPNSTTSNGSHLLFSGRRRRSLLQQPKQFFRTERIFSTTVEAAEEEHQLSVKNPTKKRGPYKTKARSKILIQPETPIEATSPTTTANIAKEATSYTKKNLFVPIDDETRGEKNIVGNVDGTTNATNSPYNEGKTIHNTKDVDDFGALQERNKHEIKQQQEQQSSSFSPWLHQLSKKDAPPSIPIASTTIIPLNNGADSVATIECSDTIDVSHDKDIEDDESLTTTKRKKKKNKKQPRSGGSGNDFDGMGYDGNANSSEIGNPDSNVDNDDMDSSIEFYDSHINENDRVPSIDNTTIDPKETWPIDPNVYPHIRCNLSDVYKMYSNITTENAATANELMARDTGLSVCTLGTSAGGACRLRSNTSTVVRSGAYCYLVDAGEGIMRQFMLSRLRFNDIRKIFITHMHADHIFGLPGLLLGIQTARLTRTTPNPIEVYGPVGLHNYIATSLRLACIELRKIKVYVYELHGGTQRSMRAAANRKTFAEFHHHGLVRKAIPQNADGTWTLMEPLEIITPEQAESTRNGPQGFSIKAGEIHHIPELQCFGYTFQEPVTQPRPLDVERARELGINAPKKYRLLKAGFSVMDDDNTRLIHPDEVCGQPNRPRKITVLGDCCMVPPAMEALSLNSDVLIHEATLSIYETGKKVLVGGHATSAQAAIFANKVKAQVLLLNHLPKSLNSYVKCKEWLRESESRIRGPTKVQITYDHLEVVIPRNGFTFDETIESKSLWPDDRKMFAQQEQQQLQVKESMSNESSDIVSPQSQQQLPDDHEKKQQINGLEMI